MDTNSSPMSWNKENLVAEGGGIKGIAFYGAIQALHERNLLSTLSRFAGSSAGAMMAAALACRFPLSTLEAILVKTNFSSFKDDDWGIVRDIYRLFHHYGYYKGHALRDWFEGLLYQETSVDGITFDQVYQRYGTDLVITGTNLSQGITEYYHRSTTPHMKISDAVRISISLPYFFEAVQRPRTDTLYGHDAHDILVDGGVLNNYPIWVFAEDGSLCTQRSKAIYNPKTLGLKLMDTHERQDDQLSHEYHSIENLKEFSMALLNTMLLEVERGYVLPGYWDNTVCIPTLGVKTTDFELSDERKQALVQSGYNAMMAYLDRS